MGTRAVNAQGGRSNEYDIVDILLADCGDDQADLGARGCLAERRVDGTRPTALAALG